MVLVADLWMKQHNIPITREKYLGLAYGNELPDPWTPERSCLKSCRKSTYEGKKSPQAATPQQGTTEALN